MTYWAYEPLVAAVEREPFDVDAALAALMGPSDGDALFSLRLEDMWGESEDPAGYKWELIALHAPDFGDDSRPDSVAFELRWTGDGTPIYEVRADVRIRGGAAATHEAFAAFVRSLYQDAIDGGWHLQSVTVPPS